jgi:hypothetical protein
MEYNTRTTYSDNIKKILLDYQYIEAVSKFDLASNNDQIVQYFSILGMNDPDILHSIMAVKEMIYCRYCLNDDQDVENSGVLYGERPYFAEES